MPYLLDTNAAIGLMKGHPGIATHVRRVGRLQLRLCAIVEAELWFGVAKSVKAAENADRLGNGMAPSSRDLSEEFRGQFT